MPRLAELGIDRTALLFTFALSLVTSLGFGLAPALRAARSEVAAALRSLGKGSAGGTSSPHARRARRRAGRGLVRPADRRRAAPPELLAAAARRAGLRPRRRVHRRDRAARDAVPGPRGRRAVLDHAHRGGAGHSRGRERRRDDAAAAAWRRRHVLLRRRPSARQRCGEDERAGLGGDRRLLRGDADRGEGRAHVHPRGSRGRSRRDGDQRGAGAAALPGLADALGERLVVDFGIRSSARSSAW